MATQNVQKILRIGIIQNGRIIEERLLRARESVSVGQKLKNTFVIASSEFPATFLMFGAKGTGYTLNFTEKMVGRISLGDGVFDLKALRESGKAKRSGEGWTVEISERSRGKVALGEVTILFQFVNAPPLTAAPQLPANMRGNLLSFLSAVLDLEPVMITAFLSQLLLQGGGIAYLVLWVPPPPRSTGFQEVPDRFISVIQPEQEEPEVPPMETEPTDGELAEGTGAAVEEPAEDSRPSENQTDQPQADNSNRTREEIREQAQVRVRQESALAAFYAGGDDATGPSLGLTSSISERRADEVIARQQAMGGSGGGDGIVSSTGLGTSQGAEGGVDRLRAETGGGSSVVENVRTGGTEEVQGVQVRVNVRGEDEQTAGTGRMDQDALRSVLRRRQRDIERCYERGLAQNPQLAGRVVVQFTIGTDGRVEDVRLRDSELGSAVDSCITSAVRRWRFDAPEGGSLTVRRPYIFTSSN